MSNRLIAPPAAEPLSLADARLHLRIDSDMTADDTLISSLITAARQYAEGQTRRALVTQTWLMVLDSFPGASEFGVPFGTSFSLPANAILLEKCPVQSVTSIRYLDMGGTWQTMPATDYVVDVVSEPARITPVFGKIWPIPLPQIGSVQVTYVAGYGAPDVGGNWSPGPVPAGIVNWMKLRVGSLYEHRGEVEVVSRGKLEPMPFVDSLLDGYRIWI
jgi:uncharacterized phiE125 gp8 family phage protein